MLWGLIWKTRWPPWHLISWDLFDFSYETAERKSMKLDRRQDLNVLYQVFFFGPIRKTRWPPWPLIDWDIFWLLLWKCWTEFNKFSQEARFQHPESQVLCFCADQKNKMAALASNWLRYFRFLLWNRWTEFNETWLKARCQCPLPSLCFFGWSEKKDGRPGLWLAEAISTSPLKLLNGIQQNLTGSKISTSSTNFVFFWPISIQKWWQIVLRCTICGPLGLLFCQLDNQDDYPCLWLAETF